MHFVEALEKKSTSESFKVICEILDEWDIKFSLHHYGTGTNLIINTSNNSKPIIGVSCHYDIFGNTAGANDNASAIAVCLDILQKCRSHSFRNFEIILFFFDEEEVGLKGSKAYVSQYGTAQMMGLLNLEMVGMGTQFALWSCHKESKGKLLESFEKTCLTNDIVSQRFDKIVTNSADHLSFKKGNLEDAFSITCISDEDIAIASHYYKALAFEVETSTLFEILKQAPLFKNYHQPSDLSIYLSEDSLQMTAEMVWETLLEIDKDIL